MGKGPKTIHEIIERTGFTFGGTGDIREMRKVLTQYARALKEVIPSTAIICDTNDSVVISKETANTAERACDWLAHSDDVSEKRVPALERAHAELWNALEDSFEGETRMGTEKMDKSEGFVTTGGDYAYPLGGELIGGCVSTAPANDKTLKPMSIAESHAMRVIDELWKMYENEPSGKGKVEILDAITNAAYYLNKMGE
jgi:hypothetical protein